MTHMNIDMIQKFLDVFLKLKERIHLVRQQDSLSTNLKIHLPLHQPKDTLPLDQRKETSPSPPT